MAKPTPSTHPLAVPELFRAEAPPIRQRRTARDLSLLALAVLFIVVATQAVAFA